MRRLEQPFVSAYTLGLRRLRPVGGGSLGYARKYTICAVVLDFVPVIVLFHFETRRVRNNGGINSQPLEKWSVKN
jgi:hypothetical protein